MPATLHALLDRRDLGLRLLTDGATATGREAGSGDVGSATGGQGVDAPISWIHSSDLADPTPFLSEGQALLTTGTQFGTARDVDPAAVRAYVERLVARGVVALGFGTEVVRDGTPDALVAACAEAGLPLVEVPYRTSFIAVAQANAETIAREANARTAWALAAQRAISLAAMRPDGLGATLAELSRQLDCWVGLLDATGRLDRAFPSDALPAEDVAVLQTESSRLLRGRLRASLPVTTADGEFTLQTLGTGGRLYGILAIGTPSGGTGRLALDHAGREVVTAVIALAGLALQQNRALGHARGLLRSGLLTMLTAGDPAVVDSTSRQLWGPLPAEPVRVAALRLPGVDATDGADADAADVDAVVDALELFVQEHPGRLFHALDGALFVCVSADDVELVGELARRHGLHAGVSDPASYASFGRARTEALRALERSRERAAGDAGTLVEFGDLAREGVLAFLETTDARTIAETFLAPIVDHDRANGTEIARTVRVWLEQDCEYDRTARALGVHRHTARARVELAGKLLGRDLRTFATRADVWAAFVARGGVVDQEG